MNRSDYTLSDKHFDELEELLTEHLQFNHFPPVTPLMVEPCIESIFAVMDDDHEKTIMYGEKEIGLAYEIVEDLHLDWFIDVWPNTEVGNLPDTAKLEQELADAGGVLERDGFTIVDAR